MGNSVEQMWARFLASGTRYAREAAEAHYTSWHFGSGAEMADELAALVLGGKKRATAGALWSYEAEGEPVPQAGDYSVIIDGSGHAQCVIRTTCVNIVPFSRVDAEFAAEEGEGDLSLTYWREGHWYYFTKDLATHGLKPERNMPIVCERFEVVYPVADSYH